MKIFFNSKTNGFYHSDLHGDNIPAGSVEITQEQYDALHDGQSSGKTISSGFDGSPLLSDLAPQTTDELAALARINRDKLIATTDYLVMPDYPIAADLLGKVKAYRQALRDITNQEDFPTEIDWPVNPMDAVAV